MPLPINVPKRGLSKQEAAEYCGVSENTEGSMTAPTVLCIGIADSTTPMALQGRRVYTR
ncbi:MAG: hypothetical protein WA709_11280 [Stellaceae bacterium]